MGLEKGPRVAYGRGGDEATGPGGGGEDGDIQWSAAGGGVKLGIVSDLASVETLTEVVVVALR